MPSAKDWNQIAQTPSQLPLEEEIPVDLRVKVVVVFAPSHAGESHCTRYHPDYGSSKDLETGPGTSKNLFSNHYFPSLY